jgi:DNA-binding GntR family transcriptional regulator
MGRFTSQKTFQTKEEYVFEMLRDAILHLRLAPGEKLVVDRLSEEIGVSPIPVRTALQRLEAEGLVRIVPFTGTVVADVTPREVDEIFAILEALEQAAFQAAARVNPAPDASPLETILADMDEAAGRLDYETWSGLNRRFHMALSEMSGMLLLADFTRRAFDRWDRLRRFFFRQGVPARMAAAQMEHHKMLVLLRAGQAGELSQLVSAHNRGARESYRLPVP